MSVPKTDQDNVALSGLILKAFIYKGWGQLGIG